MRRLLTAFAALAVIASAQLINASVAEAHESRNVGPYKFVVGFLSEPAFAGTVNGIDITITDPRSNPPKNIEGVEKTLTARVYSGGLTNPLDVTLATRFGLPGKYAGYFIPTRSGSYRFIFQGKVEQQDVNETFESGPGRFNDVQDTTALQYPTKVPQAADLTDRLDAIDRDLGSLRLIAIAAVALAIVVPLGTTLVTRRSRV
jgi:hypothetical protein